MSLRPEFPRPSGFGAPGEMSGAQFELPPPAARFAERLAQLQPRMVQPMPDFGPQLNHSGQEIDRTTVDRLDHAYFTEELRPEGEQPAQYGFAFMPGWQLGRDESQHQAFFGLMHVKREGDATRKLVPVAVKEFPYLVGHLAVNEQGMLQDLRQRGLPAIKPLGIMMNRWSMDPGVFVITALEQDLESLNAQDWEDIQAYQARDRVKPVTDTLSMLHGEGVFPHELAFGNVGVGEAEDSRFIFDLESAKSFRDILDSIGPEDSIPDELFIAFRQDFVPPRVSLHDFVFRNLPPEQRPRTIEELFNFDYHLVYEPYLIAIRGSNSRYRPVLERMFYTMMQHVRTELEAGQYGYGMYKDAEIPRPQHG